MTRAATALLAAALAVAAAGCSHTAADKAVPRRTAYPRPAPHDTSMVAVDSLPVYFEASADAAVTHPGPLWLDIAYPAYEASIHVSFTPATASTLGDILSNRLQRLSLNAGDSRGVSSRFDNDHGFGVLIVATEATSTPVQFIATDSSAMVVSGAVYLSNPAAAANVDSVAPIVKILLADVTRSLSALRHHD